MVDANPCDDNCGEGTLHDARTYTLIDIAASVWGALVFAAALWAPGFLAGWTLNIAQFRTRSWIEQAAWSLTLSLGLGTILVVGATWVFGAAGAGFMLVAVSAAAVMLWVRAKTPIAIRGAVVSGLIAWMLVVILSLVDIGHGSRLWMSVTVFDHSVRTAFVDAVMRTGAPPVNPLYWPGHDAPLRYYYFWYVTCGVVAKIAHISARQAFIASCVWPALGVVATISLFGKYVLGWSGQVLRRRMGICLALLSITGLDALVTLFNWRAGGDTPGDMEWWSIDQVASWLDTFLWVPHHAAGLVCCLLCFLMLWLAEEEGNTRKRAGLAVVAGLSYASAFGLSTYMVIGFSLMLAAWLVRAIVVSRKGEAGRLGGLLWVAAGAGLIACIVLAPYVVQLLGHGAGQGPATTKVLTIGVRQMLDPDMLFGVPWIARLGPVTRVQVSALVLLLPGYFIEFGFFAVTLILAFRLPHKTEGERALLFLFVTGMLAVSFLRSNVIATNDYGVRASLLPQFMVLLLSVRVCEEAGRWWKRALLALAVVGVAGTVYQVIVLRVFLPMQEHRGASAMIGLAERSYALRDAYSMFAKHAPRSARIQYGNTDAGYFNYIHMLNTGNQIVTADAGCNTSFGGEASACENIQQAVHMLFTKSGAAAPEGPEALKACARGGIEYLIVTRWDGAWNSADSWPWKLPALVSTPDVRIVRCTK